MLRFAFARSQTKVILAAIALAALGSPAHADTSADLVHLCEQYQELPKDHAIDAEYIQLKSSCAGFINSHVRLSRPDDGFCRPKAFNIDDLVGVYMDFMKKHSDRINEPTKTTMSAALAEVYPCPKP